MGTTETVVILDYGFCKREEQDAELLTVLVIHDRHTKSFHAVSTKSKAGQSMSYLVTELVRFVSFLGHREVCFRSDDERPLLALMESAKRACRHLGSRPEARALPSRTTRPMVRWSKRGSKFGLMRVSWLLKLKRNVALPARPSLACSTRCACGVCFMLAGCTIDSVSTWTHPF